MDLKTFQDDVLQAIAPRVSNQGRAEFAAFSALPGVPLARAIEVHRANAYAVLQRALEETYPAILKLIGSEEFSAISQSYALAEGGCERDLNAYGCNFSSFLETVQNNRGLSFLVDLARLEWAMHRAFYAVDDEPTTALDVAKSLQENGEDTRLFLRTSASLIESRWRISEIRERIEKNGSVPDDFCRVSSPERLFIYKHEFLVRVGGVEDELWPLLVAIAAGEPLGMIARRFEASGTSIHLAEGLSVTTQRKWIAA